MVILTFSSKVMLTQNLLHFEFCLLSPVILGPEWPYITVWQIFSNIPLFVKYFV